MGSRAHWGPAQWTAWLSFFVLVVTVGGIIVRWAITGKTAVNHYVDGRAAAVADTVARRVVHDSLATPRQHDRRYHR